MSSQSNFEQNIHNQQTTHTMNQGQIIEEEDVFFDVEQYQEEETEEDVFFDALNQQEEVSEEYHEEEEAQLEQVVPLTRKRGREAEYEEEEDQKVPTNTKRVRLEDEEDEIDEETRPRRIDLRDHIADMEEAFNTYIATLREAQDIFRAALS